MPKTAMFLCKSCSQTFSLDLKEYDKITIQYCENCIEGETEKVLKQRFFYRGGKSLVVVEDKEEG